ncbi:MAG: glycosyltransferase, partial [Acidobacteriota bacterium]
GRSNGEGSFPATLQLAELRVVGPRQHLRGGVANAQVPAQIQRGDIFLNTARIDNTPVSVLEAMACGLPVVSTNVGGIPYLLTPGRTGLLTAPDNAGAMAAAIRALLRNPALAAGLSAAGRDLAAACGWSRVLPQWQQLLHGLRRRPSL